MSERPSRRKVMRAFGLYLDYAEWFNKVKAGLDEPPTGEGIPDMARGVKHCQENYHDQVEAYLTFEESR